MGKTLVARLAAAAAGGALAFAAAAPAVAHDDPADGFNAVLHGPHHGLVAADAEFDKCDVVREDAGDEADGLIKDGFDVWVFNIPSGQFDLEAAVILSVTFQDLGGSTQTVAVPGDDAFWVGPEANPHLVAVSVPAGWTLLDGDFNVTTEGMDVRVTHTCAGEPGNGETPPPGNGETPPPGNGETPPPGENGEGGEKPGDDEGLPVTGMQVGGLVMLGTGLLAAGVAMLAVRRRRGLAGLTDS